MKQKTDEVLRVIEQQGPVSHERICNEVNIEWYDLQSRIKQLRGEGLVVITVDRKYDTANNDRNR